MEKIIESLPRMETNADPMALEPGIGDPRWLEEKPEIMYVKPLELMEENHGEGRK